MDIILISKMNCRRYDETKCKLHFTKYILLHLLFLGRVYPRNLTVWKHNKQRGKDGSLYA